MIEPTFSETIKEADLNLFRLAPKLYQTLITINDKIDNIFDDSECRINEEVSNELHDIQNTIMETLNSDGNLNGTAIWV